MADEFSDDGSVKGMVLDQVLFMLDAQVTYSRRFLADQVIFVDETF